MPEESLISSEAHGKKGFYFSDLSAHWKTRGWWISWPRHCECSRVTVSDEGRSQGRRCSLIGLRGVTETCCPLALTHIISSSRVILRSSSTKSPNTWNTLKKAQLLESQLSAGLSFSKAVTKLRDPYWICPTYFLLRDMPNPIFGVFLFFSHSRLYGIIQNSTWNVRAGELSSDPSSATATCGTSHRQFHLFNTYWNEPFLHIRSRSYKNV